MAFVDSTEMRGSYLLVEPVDAAGEPDASSSLVLPDRVMSKMPHSTGRVLSAGPEAGIAPGRTVIYRSQSATTLRDPDEPKRVLATLPAVEVLALLSAAEGAA